MNFDVEATVAELHARIAGLEAELAEMVEAYAQLSADHADVLMILQRMGKPVVQVVDANGLDDYLAMSDRADAAEARVASALVLLNEYEDTHDIGWPCLMAAVDALTGGAQ